MCIRMVGIKVWFYFINLRLKFKKPYRSKQGSQNVMPKIP